MPTETIGLEPRTKVEGLHDVRPDESDAGIRGIVTGVAAGTLVWLAIGALFFL